MSRRRIAQFEGTTYTAKVHRDAVWGEYRVTLVKGEKILSTYHSDDKEDALSTAQSILKQAERQEAERPPKKAERPAAYQLYGRYNGCDDRWPFLHTFAVDEEGRECAFEAADEILWGHYDGSGDTEFDSVDIMLGEVLIAEVCWDQARHGQL